MLSVTVNYGHSPPGDGPQGRFYGSSIPTEVADGLAIQISEDGGDTWADAFSAPYTTTVRVKNGQTLWVKILKTGDWTDQSQVVIEHTSPDEYGNETTKEYPVRWPA